MLDVKKTIALEKGVEKAFYFYERRERERGGGGGGGEMAQMGWPRESEHQAF